VQEVEGERHTLQIAASLDVEAMGMFSCNATTNLGSVEETTRVTGLPCNDPQPLERSLELVSFDPEDETAKVELCSNDDTSLNSDLNVDKTNQHFGSETNYPDYKPNTGNGVDISLNRKLNVNNQHFGPETNYPDYKPTNENGVAISLNSKPNEDKSNQHFGPETNYPDYKPTNENAGRWVFEEAAQPDDGEGEESNMIDQAESRDVEKPDVYFESNSNEAEMAKSGTSSNAEEVRLSGASSRSLHGDLLTDHETTEKKKTKSNPEEVEQTRTSTTRQKNSTSSVKKEVEATKSAEEKNSKLDSSHSLTNSSREVKESDSKGKKESKRLMSSPWILILTILFLFILACIILAVLR